MNPMRQFSKVVSGGKKALGSVLIMSKSYSFLSLLSVTPKLKDMQLPNLVSCGKGEKLNHE